jgi:hypothetical protein
LHIDRKAGAAFLAVLDEEYALKDMGTDFLGPNVRSKAKEEQEEE